MAKKRKNPEAQSSSRAETIPESEQWRIIEQTGALKNIPRKAQTPGSPDDGSLDDEDSPFCNEVFNSALLVIPFSSLYIMMDMYALWCLLYR